MNLFLVYFLFHWFYTLKTEAIHSSETLVHIRTARHYISEDGNIHNYRCENLKTNPTYTTVGGKWREWDVNCSRGSGVVIGVADVDGNVLSDVTTYGFDPIVTAVTAEPSRLWPFSWSRCQAFGYRCLALAILNIGSFGVTRASNIDIRTEFGRWFCTSIPNCGSAAYELWLCFRTMSSQVSVVAPAARQGVSPSKTSAVPVLTRRTGLRLDGNTNQEPHVSGRSNLYVMKTMK
jgi:hypothetical protein